MEQTTAIQTAPAIGLPDVLKMGEIAAKSGFLGVRNADEAITLMLVAQSEGRHPMTAAKEYHIIKGKPALKADAMLARFQLAGGKVEWKTMTDDRVVGVFSHPQGGSVEVDWDMARARKAQVVGVNPNWGKYPRQMLRARCISEGVRSVYPAVICGFYTKEEVEDIVAEESAKERPEYAREAAPAPVKTKKQKPAEILKEAAEKASKKQEAVEVEAEVVKPDQEPEPQPSPEEPKVAFEVSSEPLEPAPKESAEAIAARMASKASAEAEQPKSPADDMAEWIESARDAAEHGVSVTELKEKGWAHFGKPLPSPVLNALMEIYKKQQEDENGRS